ncbi:MAG: hypothetical protein EKK46_03265 [Rhodocyclaceae bacterium]|nr:MAG: hypothetical protein EKK46_03265 [Rhodocyclaceae bacterium]
MTISETSLQDLVRMGKLKFAPSAQNEFEQLVRAGRRRLIDARNEALATESRFDIAYNACNVLTLAAFRWKGLRPNTAIPLFLLLPYLMVMDATAKKTLAKSYEVAHSEGLEPLDYGLAVDLIQVVMNLLSRVEGLGPVLTEADIDIWTQ